MPTETLELRDIHLPDSVSWWPPAIGWWLVLFAIILCCVLVFWFRKRWLKKQRSAKVLAGKELNLIHEKYHQHKDQKLLIEDLSILLRRVCLSVYPRENSAGLTGENWLKFLDEVMDEKRFSQGAGRSLITAPYEKDPEINVDELFDLCKDWIEVLP